MNPDAQIEVSENEELQSHGGIFLSSESLAFPNSHVKGYQHARHRDSTPASWSLPSLNS